MLTASYVNPAQAKEQLYPQALMNWLTEGTFHALIADKSQQRLTVWKIKDGEPSLVESFRCSTGESHGDKWVRGDMKTPEGVYLFCSVIDGRRLPAKYGLWAFTTDYPNFVDRRRGKSGDGIWLHGRDKPLAAKPDSNGCIALENQDLAKVSRYIRLQDTPLIVVDRLLMAPRSHVVETERRVRDFVESWRRAWESRRLDDYMAHYSPNFQSCWFDLKSWKEKKRKLAQRYKKIHVRLGDVYVYRQDGIVTAIFNQTYTSDGFQSSGLKVLYLVDNNGQYGIYSEDYHQPVDDAFPVRVLLARLDDESRPGHVYEPTNDFRIRLVSTDEPDQSMMPDTETPRPSAPSRGVVLDRLASGRTEPPDVPALLTVERVASPDTERLLTARLMPSPTDAELPEPVRSARVRDEAVPTAQERPDGPNQTEQAVPGPVAVAAEDNVGNTSSGGEGERAKPPAPAVANTDQPKSEPDMPKKRDIMTFLNKWKQAWEQKNLDRFMKMYHPKFEQGRVDYADFLKSKRAFFRKYQNIKVEIDQLETSRASDQVHIKFLQTFQGDGYRDKGWKHMVLAGGKGEGLRIVQERWSPYEGLSSNTRTKGQE